MGKMYSEAPGAAAPAVPAAPLPGRPRRVGTFTMGVCLLGAGALLALGLVNPRAALRLSSGLGPLLLLLLGGELLACYFCHRQDPVKYDMLSVVVCGLLIFCSFGVFGASQALLRFGPAQSAAARRLEDELAAQCHALLKGDAEIATLRAYVELEGVTDADSVALSDLPRRGRARVFIEFLNPFADQAAFAKAARRVLDGLGPLRQTIGEVRFTGAGEAGGYRLAADSLFGFDMPAGDLQKLVASP